MSSILELVTDVNIFEVWTFLNLEKTVFTNYAIDFTSIKPCLIRFSVRTTSFIKNNSVYSVLKRFKLYIKTQTKWLLLNK